MAATHQSHAHRGELVAVARTPDPTQTTTVRRRYAQALRAGYQQINALIREFVENRDFLRLDPDPGLTAARPPPSFEFTTDDQKVEGFRDWLMEAQREDVLAVIERGENRYVRQAYETGVRSANADIRQAGFGDPSGEVVATVRQPVHERTLQLLYTRNFNELEGLTDEIGREVARELTQALGEGTGPREAGRRIRDILGTVEDGTPHGAQARATMIARTETLRARHMAAAEQFERFGVERVEPLLSPTACEVCVGIAADAPYPVSEMRSLLPAHPNCRCSWTIVTDQEATAAFYVPVERARLVAASPEPMTPARSHATAV